MVSKKSNVSAVQFSHLASTSFAQSRRTEQAHRKMQRHDLYKRGRGFPLSCLSFGEHRKTEYPDFFFCHGCDLLEDAVRIGAKRAHREQKKYWCTAGHTNLLHPTTKKSLTDRISRHRQVLLQAYQEVQQSLNFMRSQVQRMTACFLQQLSCRKLALARRNNAESLKEVHR